MTGKSQSRTRIPATSSPRLEAEVAQRWRRSARPRAEPLYRRSARWSGSRSVSGGAVLACGYGLGSLRKPGPGLWPFIVSVLIAALSAVLLGGRPRTHRQRGVHPQQPAPGGRRRHLRRVRSADAVGRVRDSRPAALPSSGCKVLGGESWRNTAIISVVTVAAFYFLFLYGLRIPLPHLIKL